VTLSRDPFFLCPNLCQSPRLLKRQPATSEMGWSVWFQDHDGLPGGKGTWLKRTLILLDHPSTTSSLCLETVGRDGTFKGLGTQGHRVAVRSLLSDSKRPRACGAPLSQ
jgi:hypothetical protein